MRYGIIHAPAGMQIILLDGNTLKTVELQPQQADALHNVKAKSAKIFKEVRDRVAYDPEYVTMRKEWRSKE